VQSAHYKGKKKENLADRWIKVAEWVAKKTNQSYSSAAARKHWESLKDKFLAKHNLNADSNNVEDVINQLNELEIEENAAENLTRDLVHDVLNESYNKQKKNDEKTQKAVQQTMLEETSSKALDRAGNAALKAVENLPGSTSSSSFTLQQPKKKQRREVIDLEAIDECLVNLAKPSETYEALKKASARKLTHIYFPFTHIHLLLSSSSSCPCSCSSSCCSASCSSSPNKPNQSSRLFSFFGP
jgi:chemotaxis protein histidine kinase CheA